MRARIISALLLAGIAAPAMAQRAPDVDQRVDRLEKEMRAVQRKVFPGGSQEYFEPEIAPQAPPPPPGGVPAGAPIIDLTARVSSLEQALAKLTDQVETNSYKLRQLEQTITRMRADMAPGTAPGGGAPGAGALPPSSPFGPPTAPPGAAPPAPVAPPPAAGGDVAPSPPSSGDPAEDAYLAGYRLWVAKKYPEAEKTLRDMVAKYPNHRRASYAQNLLGRALLDDGQPAKAAEAFYTNYQKMPRGERAPDSLYFLGQSLMALKPPKPADACKVYAELLDVYGEKIDATLKARVAKGKADAKCK